MESRISRRDLLRSTAGSAVVKVVGIGGLMELLANREAVAAGSLIQIVGATRERTPLSEVPHRHTYAVNFFVTHVDPSIILGNAFGRTLLTFSTGREEEEDHFHFIRMAGVSLEALILTGPENGEPGEHMHPLSLG